jgi:ammonia channel protein AmtB
MTLDSINPAAKTIPEALFMLYQMTFAIITVALVAGSVTDRMRFSAYLLLLAAWWCICPPSGFVTPLQGIVIGVTAGLVCFWACTWHEMEGLDISQRGEALQRASTLLPFFCPSRGHNYVGGLSRLHFNQA